MHRSVVFLLLLLPSCSDLGDAPRASAPISIQSDAGLFRHIMQVEPFTGYSLFPRVDSVTSGTLNGSHAHQPLVRVSINTTASGILQDGRLPAGVTFPDGSIIFKEILMGGTTVLYAVMYKDASNRFAGNGWLWAEYRPDGTVDFSLTTRGISCVGCHSFEQGPQHDFVRTFERQH